MFSADEHSLGAFLVISVFLGGGAAWLAGRAIATTWRPWWHLALYMLVLAATVRFLHFALVRSELLSPTGYAIDLAVCLACGLLGFRLARVAQMVTRYPWLNRRAGWLSWRQRDDLAISDMTESG
ncbi:MAG: hypothetical protein IT537_23370 [Hyphomicrobiales bacterium]|nr:hypothetical protein [Hyphomicrobiales bacterium]